MKNINTIVLEKLKDEITPIEYMRYITSLCYDEEKSNSHLVIYTAPNALVANWVKTKYSDTIAHLFEIKTGIKPVVAIIVNTQNVSELPNIALSKDNNRQDALLNPSYTFENFVVGGSNKFAFLAAKSASSKPGIVYNPLFIHGGVGLGKTHLMHAVGNILQAQGKNVIYTSVENFLNDFMRYLRNKTMEKFKDKYRKCDLLLIDDVQFLSGKIQVQEEFFHTFEALKNENKQIIITSDQHPSKIIGLEERLNSRFEWGLVANIQPPELETKIEIIKKKCEINRVQFDTDVINYIATVIENNTRQIEGIITKLNAFSQLMGVDITIDFVKNIFPNNVTLNHLNCR